METCERCEVWQIGRISYPDALTLQRTLAIQRTQPSGVDRLLLLEHPHTYTLGSTGDTRHLLLSEEERARRGIEVYRTDRGGDITYHGDGQIVGYPIMRLEGFSRGSVCADVVGYIRRLERVIVFALADFRIEAKTIAGITGVWVDTPRGEEKIAAIGVRVNARGVTTHGFALNVNTDLTHFDGIIPCGIPDKGVTSLAALCGHPVDEAKVRARLIRHFGNVFEREMVETTPNLHP